MVAHVGCVVLLPLLLVASHTKAETTPVLLLNVVDAIERLIAFYKASYQDMNLDGIYGLKVMEGQIERILGEHKQGRYTTLTPALAQRLLTVQQEARWVGEQAISAVKADDENYFQNMAYVIAQPWTLIKPHRKVVPELRWGLSEYQSRQHSKLGEQESDNCMMEITMPTKAKGRSANESRCSLTRACGRMMTQRGLTDYSITHQLLWTALAEKAGCGEQMSKLLRGLGFESVDSMQREFCSNNYYEMLTVVHSFMSGRVEPQYHDMFMEQQFVCPNLGFYEFLKKDYLDQILSWQLPSGCFGEVPQSESVGHQQAHGPPEDLHKPNDNQLNQKMDLQVHHDPPLNAHKPSDGQLNQKRDPQVHYDPQLKAHKPSESQKMDGGLKNRDLNHRPMDPVLLKKTKLEHLQELHAQRIAMQGKQILQPGDNINRNKAVFTKDDHAMQNKQIILPGDNMNRNKAIFTKDEYAMQGKQGLQQGHIVDNKSMYRKGDQQSPSSHQAGNQHMAVDQMRMQFENSKNMRQQNQAQSRNKLPDKLAPEFHQDLQNKLDHLRNRFPNLPEGNFPKDQQANLKDGAAQLRNRVLEQPFRLSRENSKLQRTGRDTGDLGDINALKEGRMVPNPAREGRVDTDPLRQDRVAPDTNNAGRRQQPQHKSVIGAQHGRRLLADYETGQGSQRKLLVEKNMPGGCLAHKTGVACGALAMYLHYLLDPGPLDLTSPHHFYPDTDARFAGDGDSVRGVMTIIKQHLDQVFHSADDNDLIKDDEHDDQSFRLALQGAGDDENEDEGDEEDGENEDFKQNNGGDELTGGNHPQENEDDELTGKNHQKENGGDELTGRNHQKENEDDELTGRNDQQANGADELIVRDHKQADYKQNNGDGAMLERNDKPKDKMDDYQKHDGDDERVGRKYEDGDYKQYHGGHDEVEIKDRLHDYKQNGGEVENFGRKEAEHYKDKDFNEEDYKGREAVENVGENNIDDKEYRERNEGGQIEDRNYREREEEERHMEDKEYRERDEEERKIEDREYRGRNEEERQTEDKQYREREEGERQMEDREYREREEEEKQNEDKEYRAREEEERNLEDTDYRAGDHLYPDDRPQLVDKRVVHFGGHRGAPPLHQHNHDTDKDDTADENDHEDENEDEEHGDYMKRKKGEDDFIPVKHGDDADYTYYADSRSFNHRDGGKMVNIGANGKIADSGANGNMANVGADKVHKAGGGAAPSKSALYPPSWNKPVPSAMMDSPVTEQSEFPPSKMFVFVISTSSLLILAFMYRFVRRRRVHARHGGRAFHRL